MKGYVGLVIADPQRTVYPYKMVTHQLQVRCRPVKGRRSKTDVLPLSYTTPPPVASLVIVVSAVLVFYRAVSHTESHTDTQTDADKRFTPATLDYHCS